MDISATTVPNSAQINAEDLLSHPVTVTITSVDVPGGEQPVHIHVAEFPDRTYRPSKTMRKLIVSAWGPEASNYTGRRLTLYRNPDIRFGKDIVGGIEISHASDIAEPITVPLTVTRGRRKNFTVQPLPAERAWLSELADTGGDADLIRGLGTAARNANAPATVMTAIRDAYNSASQG